MCKHTCQQHNSCCCSSTATMVRVPQVQACMMTTARPVVEGGSYSRLASSCSRQVNWCCCTWGWCKLTLPDLYNSISAAALVSAMQLTIGCMCATACRNTAHICFCCCISYMQLPSALWHCARAILSSAWQHSGMHMQLGSISTNASCQLHVFEVHNRQQHKQQ